LTVNVLGVNFFWIKKLGNDLEPAGIVSLLSGSSARKSMEGSSPLPGNHELLLSQGLADLTLNAPPSLPLADTTADTR
jgi:hypothetical protein